MLTASAKFLHVPAAGGDQATRLRSLMVSLARPAATDRKPARSAASCPIIAISSGKGGVGKTTIAVNLAIALARMRKRVVLLDADLGTANADVLCGLNPTRRLDAALDGRSAGRAMRMMALDAPGGFRLIPGAVGAARLSGMSDSDSRAVLDGLAEVESGCDALLVDTGAGVGGGVTGFVQAADVAIIVATPEPTSIADAYALIKSVAGADSPPNPQCRLMLLINQVASPNEAASVHGRIDAVARRFLGSGVPMLGHVHSDSAVGAAVRRRMPVLIGSPRSAAARDLRAISDQLAVCVWPESLVPTQQRSLLRRFFHSNNSAIAT